MYEFRHLTFLATYQCYSHDDFAYHESNTGLQNLQEREGEEVVKVVQDPRSCRKGTRSKVKLRERTKDDSRVLDAVGEEERKQ